VANKTKKTNNKENTRKTKRRTKVTMKRNSLRPKKPRSQKKSKMKPQLVLLSKSCIAKSAAAHQNTVLSSRRRTLKNARNG